MSARVFVVSVLALGVGCLSMPEPPTGPGGIDAPKDGSGSGFDASASFTCLGNQPPTTAPPTVSLSGLATTIQGTTFAPAQFFAVELWRFSAGSYMLFDTSTTQADGTWTVGPVSASGPVDAYVVAHLPVTPDRPTTFYPSYWVDNDLTGIALFSVTTPNLDNALSSVGLTQDPAKGLLDILVTDCNGAPLSANTITVRQISNSAVVGQSFSAEGLLGAGRFLHLNVPPVTVSIDVIHDGMTFRRQVVPVTAGANTATVVRPGY